MPWKVIKSPLDSEFLERRHQTWCVHLLDNLLIDKTGTILCRLKVKSYSCTGCKTKIEKQMQSAKPTVDAQRMTAVTFEEWTEEQTSSLSTGEGGYVYLRGHQKGFQKAELFTVHPSHPLEYHAAIPPPPPTFSFSTESCLSRYFSYFKNQSTKPTLDSHLPHPLSSCPGSPQ